MSYGNLSVLLCIKRPVFSVCRHKISTIFHLLSPFLHLWSFSLFLTEDILYVSLSLKLQNKNAQFQKQSHRDSFTSRDLWAGGWVPGDGCHCWKQMAGRCPAPKEPRTQGAHLSPSPITAYGVWGLIYPPLSSVPPFFLLLARKMFFLEPVVTSPLKTTFVSCMWRLVSYSLPSWIPLLLWRFLLWDQSNTTWPQPLLPRVWYFAYYFSYINTLLKNCKYA